MSVQPALSAIQQFPALLSLTNLPPSSKHMLYSCLRGNREERQPHYHLVLQEVYGLLTPLMSWHLHCDRVLKLHLNISEKKTVLQNLLPLSLIVGGYFGGWPTPKAFWFPLAPINFCSQLFYIIISFLLLYLFKRFSIFFILKCKEYSAL